MQYLIWPNARDATSPIGPVIEAGSEEEAIRLALVHGKEALTDEFGYLPDPSELLAEALDGD
jgi:hypothetical protein